MQDELTTTQDEPTRRERRAKRRKERFDRLLSPLTESISEQVSGVFDFKFSGALRMGLWILIILLAITFLLRIAFYLKDVTQ